MLATLLLALPAAAASRGRFGGTLKVAVTSKVALDADPLQADTPIEVAVLSQLARPLCRVNRAGDVADTLADIGTSGPKSIVVTLRQQEINGAPLDTAFLVRMLKRLQSEPTPYRGLLLPLKSIPDAADKNQLELPLAFAFPDFAKSLCHPALSLASKTEGRAGPFLPSLTANPIFAEGRPYADALAFVTTDARGADRQLAQHRVQLTLGTGAAEAPLPFATYLAFNPARAGKEVRAAIAASVDPQDLTKFFVHPPAAPMTGLLPPHLAGAATETQKPAPAPVATRKVTLLYDSSQDDQRAVAERLQVKLQPAGYQVALTGLSRAELRTRWAAKDYDLMLTSVFLPASPGAALSVVLELAHAPHEQAVDVLQSIGAVADPRVRDRAAQLAAQQLKNELDVWPLYAQGLKVQAGPQVQHLTTDFSGTPLLDAAFLGQD
ncbi:MAG: peptide ABC transporter substrate-binding protein [Myxococcaceae bacterium]